MIPGIAVFFCDTRYFAQQHQGKGAWTRQGGLTGVLRLDLGVRSSLFILPKDIPILAPGGSDGDAPTNDIQFVAVCASAPLLRVMGLGKLIRRGRGTLGGLPPCEGVRCPTVGLWWALCRGEDGRCRGAVFCWDVVFFSRGDDSVVEDFVVMSHSRVSTSIPIGNRPFASSPRPPKRAKTWAGPIIFFRPVWTRSGPADSFFGPHPARWTGSRARIDRIAIAHGIPGVDVSFLEPFLSCSQLRR